MLERIRIIGKHPGIAAAPLHIVNQLLSVLCRHGIQQISDLPVVDVLPDKIGQPVDLPAGRRAQHELAVHLEILLELLIVQLPKIIDHGPVGVEEATEMVDDAIKKTVPWLAARGVQIETQDTYITNIESKDQLLTVSYAIRYTGEVLGDLAEYIFDLGVE